LFYGTVDSKIAIAVSESTLPGGSITLF